MSEPGLPGAWAKPLHARIKHYFPDGATAALCGAYLTRNVKPSQFGADPYVRCCPTCVRKASYYADPRAALPGGGDHA